MGPENRRGPEVCLPTGRRLSGAGALSFLPLHHTRSPQSPVQERGHGARLGAEEAAGGPGDLGQRFTLLTPHTSSAGTPYST